MELEHKRIVYFRLDEKLQGTEPNHDSETCNVALRHDRPETTKIIFVTKN